MSILSSFLRCCGLSVLLLAGIAHAETAGRVDFAVGDVTARNAEGIVRTLAKGDGIASGDTVSTNRGRAQLRFSDGGFISLHSDTVFRIDDYRWAGVSDGSERSLFSLLKGALRTVTGQLAKVNRKAYVMTTTVATIGIRGTEYTMQLTEPSLSGAVAEGEIEVCNAGGCLAVPAGQGYFVANANTRPVLSANQTYLPPTAPSSTQGALAGTVEGAGELLGGTTGALIDGLQSTTQGLVGVTQNLAGTLLGGGAPGQPLQGAVGSAGGAVGGTLDGAGALTGGALGGVGGALGGTTGTVGSTLLNLGF